MNDLFKVVIILFILFFLLDAGAQEINKRKYSFYADRELEKLVEYYRVNDSLDEIEKARGVFLWIAGNIKYDVKEFENRGIGLTDPYLVMKKKKAMCQGYANLFKFVCDDLGIQCRVINGYTKGPGYYPGKSLPCARLPN